MPGEGGSQLVTAMPSRAEVFVRETLQGAAHPDDAIRRTYLGMGFSEDILRHAEHAKMRVPHIRGEEATKHALVVPLLQVLGYEVFDPREVQPEYTADFAKKKSGQLEKIDYAVWLNGKPVLFVECKSVDVDLEDHDGQLARYFNATPTVRVAVLTNGIRLKVFGDLQQPNIMDASPWLDVDLTALKPAEIEALRRFRKVDFSPEELVTLAEEMVYFNAMTSFMRAQLREPTDAFVRYIAGEIGVGRVTQKVIERLNPILRKAMQTAILDHVAKSFADATPTPSVAPTPPQAEAKVAPKPELVPSSADSEGIVTTPEELACWEQLNAWIREARPNAELTYKDSKSYFAISQGNVRKWFIRLNVAKAPFWFVFRHLTADELRHLAPGLDVSEGTASSSARIFIRSLDELGKLRAAAIASFDREAARKGNDSPVEEAA